MKQGNEIICQKARQLFFSYRIKSVSMDDIAKLSGISKKSINQSFEDKNALVRAIVHELIQSHKRLLKKCRIVAKDAIEVIKQSSKPFEIWAAIRPAFFQVTPSGHRIFQLQKLYMTSEIE